MYLQNFIDISSIYPGDYETQIEILSSVVFRKDVCFFCSNDEAKMKKIASLIFPSRTVHYHQDDSELEMINIPYNTCCLIYGSRSNYIFDESFHSLHGRKHIIFDNFVPQNIEKIKNFCYSKDIVIHLSGNNMPDIFPHAQKKINKKSKKTISLIPQWIKF